MPNTGEEAVIARSAAEGKPGSVESSRRSYGIFSPVYDLVFGRSLRQGRRTAIDALACKPGERVLEVCIGSALSLPFYPENANVVGIDLSHEMLALAARRVRRTTSTGSRCLVQMNAERLAFADGSFDKAVVLFGVAGLSDPVRAMRELHRVCRPGATIVIANRFHSEAAWLRLFDMLLAPLYRFLSYRSDLDRDALIRQSGLELLEAKPVSLLGYSTVLVCRRRA